MQAVVLVSSLVFSSPILQRHKPEAMFAVSFDQAIAFAQKAPAVRSLQRELAGRVRNDEGVGSSAGPLQFTLMPGLTLGSNAPANFELQGAVTQGWNLFGLNKRQRASLRAEHAQIAARARVRAVRGRLDAAKYWVELKTQQSISQLIQTQLVIEEHRAMHLGRAVKAGVVDVARFEQQQVVIAELEQHQLEVAFRRGELGKRLAFAMGRSPSVRMSALGPIPAPELPAQSRLPRITDHLDKLPRVSVKQLSLDSIRANELERETSESAFGQLGAQVERAGPKRWTLFGIMGVSVPGYGQRARNRSLGRARLAEAQREVHDASLDLELEVELLLNESEHTHAASQHLETVLIPRLEEINRRGQELVAVGEIPEHESYDAQRRCFQAKLRRIRALGNVAWARLRLWLIVAELAAQGVQL